MGGYRNLWIPTRHHLFIAPEMIVHYIEAHGYQPPEPFIQAVLECPIQECDLYFERMHPFWNDRFPEYPLGFGR